jgi:hypothetical protein
MRLELDVTPVAGPPPGTADIGGDIDGVDRLGEVVSQRVEHRGHARAAVIGHPADAR